MDKKDHLTLTKLKMDELKPGDILLEQTYGKQKLSPTSWQIEKAQTFLTHNTNGGTGESYHALIVTHFDNSPLVPTPWMAEAVPPSVRRKNMLEWSGAAIVCRLEYDQGAAQLAGQAGFNLAGFATKAQNEMTRAVRAIFVPDTYGGSARKRIDKYKGRYEKDKRGPNRAFCSEFVILCYQIAMDYDNPYFPKIDAKYLVPKTLEGYLNKAWGWGLMGRFENMVVVA
jgi:hypothetical protein